METLLIKNISQLITCDDGDRVLQNVDILCEDGFIKTIAPTIEAEADEPVEDAE